MAQRQHKHWKPAAISVRPTSDSVLLVSQSSPLLQPVWKPTKHVSSAVLIVCCHVIRPYCSRWGNNPRNCSSFWIEISVERMSLSDVSCASRLFSHSNLCDQYKKDFEIAQIGIRWFNSKNFMIDFHFRNTPDQRAAYSHVTHSACVVPQWDPPHAKNTSQKTCLDSDFVRTCAAVDQGQRRNPVQTRQRRGVKPIAMPQLEACAASKRGEICVRQTAVGTRSKNKHDQSADHNFSYHCNTLMNFFKEVCKSERIRHNPSEGDIKSRVRQQRKCWNIDNSNVNQERSHVSHEPATWHRSRSSVVTLLKPLMLVLGTDESMSNHREHVKMWVFPTGWHLDHHLTHVDGIQFANP